MECDTDIADGSVYLCMCVVVGVCAQFTRTQISQQTGLLSELVFFSISLYFILLISSGFSFQKQGNFKAKKNRRAISQSMSSGECHDENTPLATCVITPPTTPQLPQVASQSSSAGAANAEVGSGRKTTFFWRLLMIVKIILPTARSWDAVILVLQCGLAVTYAWSYDYMANTSGEIVDAITARDEALFYRKTLKILFAAVAGSLANSMIIMLGEYLCLDRFRGRLTQTITERYIHRRNYFKMIHLDRRIQDPDSRIAQDVHQFCTKLKLILFGTPMYVGYIGTTATTIYFFQSLARKSTLFVPSAAILCFLVTSVVSSLLSVKPTQALNTLQEANSRFQHTHTYFAMHSEHIAFLDGHERERVKMNAQLSDAQKASKLVALLNFPLNFCTMLFFWGNQLLSYVIPGFSWLWFGNLDYTDAGTLVSVSALLYSFLSTITTYLLLSQEWTELIASTTRVGELVELLEDVEKDPTLEGSAQFVDSAGDVDVRHVTLRRPRSTDPLITDVSFQANARHSVVIMGPSGCGKSSLLRVLGGLWPATGGVISRPAKIGRDGIMFVPQKPYLTIATLPEQVYYPDETTTWSLSQIEQLLETVGLQYLLQQFSRNGGLDEVRAWSEVLSVGEQQRLGLARVLYHKPSVAVMDESTSAIDEPIESRILTEIKSRGIAMLSVAHRSTVKRFHDDVLAVEGPQSWSLHPVNPTPDV